MVRNLAPDNRMPIKRGGSISGFSGLEAICEIGDPKRDEPLTLGVLGWLAPVGSVAKASAER